MFCYCIEKYIVVTIGYVVCLSIYYFHQSRYVMPRRALTVSSRTKQAAKAKATKVAIQTMPIAIPKAGTKKRAAAQRKNGYLRIFATKSQNPSKSMNKHTVFDGTFEVGPTASNISNKLRLNPAYWKTTRFLLDRFEWRFKPCSLNSSF